MTNSLSLGRKSLVVGVIVATLMWTMSLALVPLQAQAADLAGGDLIKASGAAVYYYGSDAKRYVFPNSKTFNTWYADFSGVKTITDAELAQIPIGGNVVYRAGTRLVKITTDPKVYAVEPGGTLRHVATEEVAKALWGDDWNKMIDDVADAFFTNYQMGAALTTATPPAGSVASDGTNNYYIGTDGKKRMLSDAGMTANRLRASYVLKLDAASLAGFATGDQLTAQEGLSDTAQKGAVTGGPAVSGDVTVSMSKKTPEAGVAIPAGATYAKLICVDVNNGTNQEVRIVGVTVRRSGILADASIDGVLVTDKDGILHGSNVTFGESVASSMFGSEPIYIGAGSSDTACINVNIAAAVNTGTVGGKISAIGDVIIETTNGQRIVPKGDAPFVGPIQQIVAGGGAIGNVELSRRAVAGGTVANPTEVDQGAKDLEIAKFRVQEVSGNEDVELLNINIRNNGSAAEGDYSNVRLMDQHNKLIASAARLDNNEAKFSIQLTAAAAAIQASDIGPNGGYRIPAGQLRDFRVVVDTETQTNSANRTMIFVIQEVNDIRVIGMETEVGVTVAAAAGNVFPIGDGFNVVRFRQGTLSYSRSTASLSGKIARGATNVGLATFDVNVFGEDIEIQAIEYAVRANAAAGLAIGRFVLNGSIKIQNKAGANIYSQTATDVNNYGTNAFTVANNQIATANANGTTTIKTMNTFYTIKAGEVGQIKFVGDINQNATGADSYSVVITGYRMRRLSSNIIETQNNAINIAGNTLTVDASTLQVVQNSAFNPINLVRGGSIQKIGSFNLQSGAAEDQSVTAVQIRICPDFAPQTAAPVAADCAAAVNSAEQLQAISTITLKVGDQVVAPTFNITSPNGFTASTTLNIPSNTTKTLDVWAVVSTAWNPVASAVAAASNNVGVGLTVQSTVGSQSQATVALAESFSNYIATVAGGALAITNISDGTVNIPKLFHSSEIDVELYKFQISENANAEDITLQKLYLGARNANNIFTNFKLFRANSAAVQVGSAAPLNNGEVRFTGLQEVIQKGGVSTFIVKGSTVPAGTMALNGATVDLGVTYMEHTGEVSGGQTIVSGGVTTAAAFAAGTAGDLITVADITNFENFDPIRIDWNNDGDFLDNLDGVNEATPFFVCNINAANATLQIDDNVNCGSINDIGAIANFVAGGRLTNFALTSDAALTEESEPVISVHSSFRDLSQSTDAQVATFVFADNGPRPITIEHLVLEVSGSFENSGANTFGPKNFQLWRASNADGGKTIQITTGVAQIAYVPSGINAPLHNNAGGAAINATSVIYDTGTAGRDFFAGDRITFRTTNCAGAVIDDNQGIGFRVTQDVAGAAGTVNFSPGLRAAVADNAAICPLTGADALVNNGAGEPLGDTVIAYDGLTGAFAVGDFVSFVTLAGPNVRRNAGAGYRVVADDGANLTITPGLEAALADNDIIRADGIATDVNDVLTSGDRIRFDLPVNEQIGANSSNTYAIVADTSNIKNAAAAGTSTLTMRIPGNRGQATPANSFIWSYTSAAGNARAQLDVTDSYPVNSFTNIY